MRAARQVPALLLVAVAAACARSAVVDSPGPAYAIQVRNSMTTDMIVSYDDGSGPRILGTVAAGGTERFVIATDRASVTISAASSDRARSAGPYTIQLTAGQTPQVTLGQ